MKISIVGLVVILEFVGFRVGLCRSILGEEMGKTDVRENTLIVLFEATKITVGFVNLIPN